MGCSLIIQSRLSKLECEVLQVLSEGLTLRGWCRQSGKSIYALKYRVDRIYSKLGLYRQDTGDMRSRSVYLGIRQGYIPGPEVKKGQVPPPFTELDLEVTHLLARGLNGPQIARTIFLAECSVKERCDAARGRCGALSRPHLVAIAQAHGLV
jgi:DNA-binding NarL/FixJ family response regulator